MSETTITETCSCGATLNMSGPLAPSLTVAAMSWRKSHKHAESVGICGNRSPRIVTDEQMTCALKAGHAGWHGDGDGASWNRIGADLMYAPVGPALLSGAQIGAQRLEGNT